MAEISPPAQSIACPLATRTQPSSLLTLCILLGCYYLVFHQEKVMALLQTCVARFRSLVNGGDEEERRTVTSASSESPSINDSGLLLKLRTLNAKLYGSMSCGWTAQQMEVFSPATKAVVKEHIYVDCATQPSACGKVTHFPTWEIGGEIMPPGMVSIEVLGAQCDALLVEMVKKNRTVTLDGETSASDEKDESLMGTPPLLRKPAVPSPSYEEIYEKPSTPPAISTEKSKPSLVSKPLSPSPPALPVPVARPPSPTPDSDSVLPIEIPESTVSHGEEPKESPKEDAVTNADESRRPKRKKNR